MRAVWTILGFGVSICFALALVFSTSHNWPITWQDVAARDEVARSFLLSGFVSLMSGLFAVSVVTYTATRASARMLPPPSIALALRKAVSARDPRVVSIEQVEHPAQGSAAEEANALTTSTFWVAAPELLTRPLALAVVVFAAGLIPLAITSNFLAFGISGLSDPPNPYGGPSPAEQLSILLLFVGIFAPLALWALVSAWRFWIRWRAKVRGAEVAASAEGLTIRDQETLWRKRLIPWSEVVSLARFTYNDIYVQARTVYLLDAGNQTFLWESPPDMRYAASARRAQIAEQQANAARLLAHIAAVTGLPLLNISGVVSAVAKVDPDPYSTSDEPDPGDAAILDFLDGATSTKPSQIATAAPTKTRQ